MSPGHVHAQARLGTGQRPQGTLKITTRHRERTRAMLTNRKTDPHAVSINTLVRLRHEDEGVASTAQLFVVVVAGTAVSVFSY